MVIEKTEFCETLNCERVQAETVCGLRTEENGIRLKLFKNECELMKYGCSVIDELGKNVLYLFPLLSTNLRRKYQLCTRI